MMNVDINKRKGIWAFGMLSSGHGSAASLCACHCIQGDWSWNQFSFPDDCVCMYVCAFAVHQMHIRAHRQTFVNPP